MEEKILILEDQYGNSLENFEVAGQCQCLYLKADGSQEEVLNQAFTKGVVQADLPARTTDVTNVIFNVNLGMNQVYNSGIKNVPDRNLTTPERLPLTKKVISKQERIMRIQKKQESKRDTIQQRLNSVL